MRKIDEGERKPFKLESSESDHLPTYNDFLERQKDEKSKILIGGTDLHLGSKDEDEMVDLKGNESAEL